MESEIVNHIIDTCEPVDAVFALRDYAIQQGKQTGNLHEFLMGMIERNPRIRSELAPLVNKNHIDEYRRRR